MTKKPNDQDVKVRIQHRTRFAGRQIRVRYDGVAMDAWRIGAPRLNVVAGGLR